MKKERRQPRHFDDQFRLSVLKIIMRVVCLMVRFPVNMMLAVVTS